MIQKEFKCTPQYKIIHLDDELRYTMGVYLFLNEDDSTDNSISFDKLTSFKQIKEDKHTSIYFGNGIHKIKKKAEQLACLNAIKKIEQKP